MGSKDTHRSRPRTRTIELLEDRRVFSADPLGGLLGGSIQHHGFEDAPALVHHATRDADFWIDSWSERDVATLASDLQQTLASAHGSTGLTGVRNDYGFIGTGQTVAVIDSGIAWNHTGLGNGLGANYRVVGGWDFAENDANPYDDGPEGSHGTHVAGIVGADSTGTSNDGVAPGVDLVGLRVFDDAGAGYFSWVESALQWVHLNRNAFENPITAVNLSLGTSWNSDTIPSWATLENEFAQLKADGIFVAVSAGNAFATYNAPGLSYPAASPHVVPVMAVKDNGALATFSQRHARAIAAPGQYIVSTVPDYVGNNDGITDDYASYSGTSMASPYIAGASVLLREAMQFVGYANITQDTIYDHMMATATSFLDSATSQTYKRINLTNAFAALMPTDEYGSTVAAAHNLGTLSGESEISGLIGKLSDSDFFRFTAAATGTVTFTASTTHGLAPVWSATGGTVSGSDGETYTFNVVAGQSYTLGLSTNGGIGYYDLAIEAESSFTYVDWGTITQSQTNNVVSAGESWYRVTASRAGYLTTEALFAAAGGNVDLAFYNSNLQLLTNGTADAAGERVELLATAGTSYYVCVTGTNADVDFRLTNLVSQSGATVSVAGTSAADTFTFSVGATQHTVGVNGTTYQFNKAAVSAINYAGDAGSDSITMTGGAGDETATLRVGNANLAGSGFSTTATGVENVTVISGGGSGDIAYLYDTSGNDTYNAWSDHATITGAGYVTQAVGFARVDGNASTGNDLAYLYDSAGNDLYRGYSDRSIMSGTGFFNRALGFDQVDGIASTGNDLAQLYDSAGNDAFVAYADSATMSGTGYVNRALGFDQVDGTASTGNDVATLYDTVGNDVFNSYSDRATMSGTGYFNRAYGFDTTEGVASVGYDLATLFDSTGDDTFNSWVDRSVMTIAGRNYEATAFDRVNAIASSGNDTANMYDSAGDDRYYAYGIRAMMVGDDYYNGVWTFDRVDAWASTGYDFAILYDTAGDDQFSAYADRAIMLGSGYYNRAAAFDRVDGFASQGNDTALLFDSAGNDVFETYPTRSTMTGTGFLNRALYFDLTQGYHSAGNDIARLYGSTGADYFDAWYDRVEFRGAGYRHLAYGFANATAYGQGGVDRAHLYDSAGNDLFRVRDWGAFISCGGWKNTAYDFDEVIADRVNGGNDTCDLQAVDYLFSTIGGWT